MEVLHYNKKVVNVYLRLEKTDKNSIAMIDNHNIQVTYGEIYDFTVEFRNYINKRTLIFILAKNNVGTAIGYVAAMSNRVVPLLLGEDLDEELLNNLINTYQPEYIWKSSEITKNCEKQIFNKYGYSLVKTGYDCVKMFDELSLLLTTSGSTGSPKLVRHSYKNLESQAKNISAFFKLTADERPLIDLPINYTYGLSVLNSHLYCGATVLLSDANIMSKEYWDFLKNQKASSFTNVPYAYEIIKKLRVSKMDLPYLKTFSQGGGKLREDLHMEFAQMCKNSGRKFIVTYGQTEGSARMAYLPHEYAITKCGSIGKAIPEGKLYIVDDYNNVIEEPDVVGEMVYEGSNVTLGYALCKDDLLKEDENHGKLYTGDMVKKDKDGFFYIIGRKKRFIKLNGLRVGLDETERIISKEFNVECACSGNDDGMIIYLVKSDIKEGMDWDIIPFISRKLGINAKAFKLKVIEKITRNEAGKILYTKLDSGDKF